MLPIFCCAFLFLGQALGSPTSNQYFDTVLHTALQSALRAHLLDPTYLVNYRFEYEDKTFFGKVKGVVEYEESTLTGLSSAFRYSECQGPSHDSSGKVFVNCTLSFSNLETSHKGRVKYGILPKVTIEAKGTLKNTKVEVGIFQGPFDSHPRVDPFQIRYIGSFDTSFTGLGPLNKHMKVLERDYQETVPTHVSSAIQDRFFQAFREAVSNVPLPTA